MALSTFQVFFKCPFKDIMNGIADTEQGSLTVTVFSKNGRNVLPCSFIVFCVWLTLKNEMYATINVPGCQINYIYFVIL